MAKKPSPELEHERDASLKAVCTYVTLEGHPWAAELRFFDDGRIECYLVDRERIVSVFANSIARGLCTNAKVA